MCPRHCIRALHASKNPTSSKKLLGTIFLQYLLKNISTNFQAKRRHPQGVNDLPNFEICFEKSPLIQKKLGQVFLQYRLKNMSTNFQAKRRHPRGVNDLPKIEIVFSKNPTSTKKVLGIVFLQYCLKNTLTNFQAKRRHPGGVNDLPKIDVFLDNAAAERSEVRAKRGPSEARSERSYSYS